MTDFHRLGTPGYEPTPENDHSRQILLPTSVENVWSAVQRMCKAILGGVYMTSGRLSPRSEFTPVPSHGSISFYMIQPQNVMTARVTPAWVHPGSRTGARISLRYEISQRYHVNAKRPPVSVWNRSAGRLERVAHA